VRHISPTTVLIALMGFGCAADRTRDAGADAAAIRALIERTAEMNRQGDAAGWVSLFEAGAVYMPPNLPEVTTREALLEIAEAGFRQYVPDVTIVPHEVEVFGDWAFARSTVTGRALPRADGDTIAVDMKQIAIYHRQADGTWKIARLIGNWNRYE
jgi:uncharacterized protein (TIGR02246 family)